MKTSIATVSISGDLREKIAAIAAAGFDGIEIFENDFLTFDGSARDVRRMAGDEGLTVTLFQPFRDFEGMPGAQRQQAFDRAERKFDLMQELGTDLMLICSNVSPHGLGGIDRAAEDLAELGERAKKRRVRVGYEALAWGRFVNDHRDAWEIVRRADHPNIGIILDSFHTLTRHISPATIQSIPKEKIFIVQLADAPLMDMDLLQWSRHLRNMPGQGDLPVRDFVKAVAATGYDGFWSLEIFNDQFRGGSPKSIAVDGYRSLINLMDQVKRDDPELRVSLPSMPPHIPVHGVEFIEFAASREEAGPLGNLLRTMGFQETARHKKKDVALYRQGGINIVINTDPQGFAHATYQAHGVSAYAMGLKVENAQDTLDRARALGAEPFEQARSPDEVALPAIKGLGDGLLYFLDTTSALANVWSTEFVGSDAGAPQRGAGLTFIDHVAQTMHYDEMLTWTLFYSSLFVVDKTPMVDIVDPSGLVRSRVIESKDGRLRLTLNGAENTRTLAGHFIRETVGSGVQHVAFTTEDIFSTAEKLGNSGFVALQISRNYYGDVQARFGLDDATIARLQEHNILYDRDAGGEFFQLYSPNYKAGFFFEIVERRGNYVGYGGPNAPFRIAAQKRSLKVDQ